jgi:hypothetical protein
VPVRTAAALGAAALVLGVTAAGCTAGVPEGKAWTVDTSAWVGSDSCPAAGCALAAYASRDFTVDARLPDLVRDGDTVAVHCFVPPPAPQRDPSGRDVHRWYLVTVGDALVWAPDVLLTGQDDLRLEPSAPGDHLASGLDVCHSAVPGR